MRHAITAGNVADAPTVHAVGTTTIEYRLVHGLVFTTALGVALLARLLPRSLHPWMPADADPTSLVGEARVAADSTAPYVFQVL